MDASEASREERVALFSSAGTLSELQHSRCTHHRQLALFNDTYYDALIVEVLLNDVLNWSNLHIW